MGILYSKLEKLFLKKLEQPIYMSFFDSNDIEMDIFINDSIDIIHGKIKLENIYE